MKHLHAPLLALLMLTLASAFSPMAHAAEGATVTATLILGSSEGRGVDSQLRSYEPHLKRMFPFDTFSQRGKGSTRVAPAGASVIVLGDGHRVSVTIAEAGGNKLRLAAKWTHGERVLINTTIVTARNQPAVLGGPRSGDGKLILLLVTR